MTKNNFREIESFDDFEAEKMRLYYELKLSQKKLLIKRMEISEALSPTNLLTTLFTELTKPLFRQFGHLLKNLLKREKKQREPDNNENKA